MASTTVEAQTADATTDKEVNVSPPSSEEQSQTIPQEESEQGGIPVTQIKHNQLIRTERIRSHHSDDDDDDNDEDSNGAGDEAASTTGPNNNGFHDESSGGSTSSGSRIPIYSSGNSSIFNAQICSPSGSFQSIGSSKSNPFSAVTAGGSGSSTLPQHRPILRPSAFKLSSGSPTQSNLTSSSLTTSSAPATSPFVLRPPKLIPTSSAASTIAPSKTPAPDESIQQTPTFVPLQMEPTTEQPTQELVEKKPESDGNDGPSGSVSAAGFVFGSNLSERCVASEGTAAAVKRKLGDENDDDKNIKKPSVSEEGEVQRPPLPQQVITGEEDEINALQMQCRLFIFDAVTSSWVERGRGLLRLNDSKEPKPTSSRLIIRTKGSLRVMLNTKVWSGMRVEKAGDKQIRLTAIDLDGEDPGTGSSSANDGINTSALRIFLIMTTSTSDTQTLTSALESRLRRISQEEERK